MEVDNGEQVLLVCEALAIPAPVYIWYKTVCEGSSMEIAVEVNRRIYLSGGNLTFSNVMTSDRGCYVCTVDNILNQRIMSEPVELRVAGTYVCTCVHVHMYTCCVVKAVCLFTLTLPSCLLP